MSYYGIKDQIVKRMGTLGYSESSEAFDFEGASTHEYGNTFIIMVVSGENDESLVDRFNDLQTWQIQIAFDKSTHADITNRDEMNVEAESIIKDLDNPDNWQGITNGAKLQKYESRELTATENYFLLTINLQIIDEIVY